jgi:hypothetical protein
MVGLFAWRVDTIQWMGRTELFPVPALRDVAEQAGRNPMVSVYLSVVKDQIIVCPMTSPDKGLYVEAEATAVQPFKSGSEVLGQSVWEALLRFHVSPQLGSPKKTDWPAFRASGEKSVRTFEYEFVRVAIEAFPCVLRVEATVPCTAADGLFVGRYISNACEFEDLGELIQQVCRCSTFVRDQEFA